MKAIDTRGNFNKYLDDKILLISDDNLKNTCLIKVGSKTCRYIMLGSNGFVCVKHTPMKQLLDELVEKGQMTSIGDNCAGLSFIDSSEKECQEIDNPL